MSAIQSIELFVAINLLIVGLSHFLQPSIWVDFFVFLHSKNNVGNIVNALIALGMGSVVFAFHFVWEWPKVLITFYAISQILKGFAYLIKPSIGLASIGKITMEKKNKFKWVGLAMSLFALSIFYNVITDNII